MQKYSFGSARDVNDAVTLAMWWRRPLQPQTMVHTVSRQRKMATRTTLSLGADIYLKTTQPIAYQNKQFNSKSDVILKDGVSRSD